MEHFMANINRRDLLKFLSASGAVLSSQGLLLGSLSSCSSYKLPKILGVKPQFTDDLVLTSGLNYQKIISYGDQITDDLIFGTCNDYIAIEEINNDELIMWVNHEYFKENLIGTQKRTLANIDKERSLVGGSIIKVKRSQGKWNYIKNDPVTKAIRGNTKIPFAGGVSIKGSKIAEGTLSNCAGGKTPWGSFLTCEENYHFSYGETDFKTKKHKASFLGWEKFYNNPPEHYGWVVEIEAKTGKAKKHTSIGRYAHECSTYAEAKNGKAIIYSGDDKNDEHVYKFISNSKNSIEKGILYVANLEKGEWLPLDLELSPVLKKTFKDQLEVLTYTREASKVLGATPLDRPEDIEIHPKTGEVFISLTNNKPKNRYHGQILKISEQGSDHGSLRFKSETFAFGGEDGGFSSPDNMAFDKNGNLWVATDISGRSIGSEVYKKFGNNGLFLIPTSGPQAGEVIQIASAPVEAELTGICFSPDQRTLFLSVQHPGENTKDLKNPTSHWPDGGVPKSSVIAISGETLTKITG